MTNRFFAIDIRDKIISLLTDGTTGLNARIDTINTERTHTTPHALTIGYEWGQNQYQLIRVEVLKSEILYNEASLDLGLTSLPEAFSVNVAGFIKSNDKAIINWVEDWIEAAVRCLHGYNDNDITWIAYTGSSRTDLYNDRAETAKLIDINFECRVK